MNGGSSEYKIDNTIYDYEVTIDDPEKSLKLNSTMRVTQNHVTGMRIFYISKLGLNLQTI